MIKFKKLTLLTIDLLPLSITTISLVSCNDTPSEKFNVQVTNNILIEDDIKLSQPQAETNHEYITDVECDEGLVLTNTVDIFVNDKKLTTDFIWNKTSDHTGKLMISKKCIISKKLSINFKTQENNISVPLTIKNEENKEGILSISCGPLEKRNLKYSINGSIWQDIPWEDKDEDYFIDKTITIPTNSYVQLKGNNETTGWNNDNDSISLQFRNDNEEDLKCSLSGNVMSLLYEDFLDKKTIPVESCFKNAFLYLQGVWGLKLQNAKNLVLPATNLSDYCYYRMFCFSPIKYTPRILPSINDKDCCYFAMFGGCQSITSSPNICLTNIEPKSSSLGSIFSSCANLQRVMIQYKGQFSEEVNPPNNYPFKLWLDAVSAKGTIYYSPSDPEYVPVLRNENSIPEGWEIIKNW